MCFCSEIALFQVRRSAWYRTALICPALRSAASAFGKACGSTGFLVFLVVVEVVPEPVVVIVVVVVVDLEVEAAASCPIRANRANAAEMLGVIVSGSPTGSSNGHATGALGR